jgi:hypothetical protein
MNESILGENNKLINELLFHKIELPKRSRIAILKLGQKTNWSGYSNDFSELNQSMFSKLIEKLRTSNRVYDASFLPAMLIPKQPSIPTLREAAARFQADLLLAYNSHCNSYQKYRFVSADETRAYCSVEAILLDIRSGIIAKSVVSSQDFSSVNQESDKNFSETIKKAELEAIATALGEVAQEVHRYLDSVGVIKTPNAP